MLDVRVRDDHRMSLNLVLMVCAGEPGEPMKIAGAVFRWKANVYTIPEWIAMKATIGDIPRNQG